MYPVVQLDAVMAMRGTAGNDGFTEITTTEARRVYLDYISQVSAPDAQRSLQQRADSESLSPLAKALDKKWLRGKIDLAQSHIKLCCDCLIDERHTSLTGTLRSQGRQEGAGKVSVRFRRQSVSTNADSSTAPQGVSFLRKRLCHNASLGRIHHNIFA